MAMGKGSKENWRSELARDLIAFGSIPFLFLTVARVSGMGLYPLQFILAAVLFFILKVIFKANLHAGVGAILLGLTSLYYGSWLFAFFALLVYAGLIYSLFYLGRKRRSVLKGVLLGIVSTGLAYFIIQLIEKKFL